MLTIKSLTGDLQELTRVRGLQETETLTGELQLEFTSYAPGDNPGHALLEHEAAVEFGGRWFRIKQLAGPAHQLTVHAVSTFFDLAGVYRDTVQGGTVTLQQACEFALAGTGWTVDATQDYILLPNFGEDNAVALVQRACKEAGAEYKILPGDVLQVRKPLGQDRGAEYRHRHNIGTLTRSFDTSAMKMKIRGYGGNGLQVTYTSPHAAKFPHLGEQEPVRDDRYTVAASLSERLQQELQDEPEVIYEVPVKVIQTAVPVDLGDPVWLVHEPLGLEFQVRVQELHYTLTLTGRELANVVLGNTKVRELADDLTEQKIEIDENAKQTESRFEQTNEQFTLEVTRLDGELIEAQAQLTITADQIQQQAIKTEKLGNDILETRGMISTSASEVLLQVDGKITDAKGDIRQETNASLAVLSGQISAKADYSDVSALGTRVNNVEFSMSAVDGKIMSKVDRTDYNGQTIGSLINQQAHLVSINAQAIELSGIVRVADTLDLGFMGSGGTKAIRFNGSNAWIYTSGDFNLTLDASNVRVEGDLYSYARGPGLRGAPVITGITSNQQLSIGLSPGGVLTVMRADGTAVEFRP